MTTEMILVRECQLGTGAAKHRPNNATDAAMAKLHLPLCRKALPPTPGPNMFADRGLVAMVTVALPAFVPSNVSVAGDIEQVELRGAPEHVSEIS